MAPITKLNVINIYTLYNPLYKRKLPIPATNFTSPKPNASFFKIASLYPYIKRKGKENTAEPIILSSKIFILISENKIPLRSNNPFNLSGIY